MKKKSKDKKPESFPPFDNFNVCIYGPPEMMRERAEQLEKQRQKAEKESDTKKED